MSLGRKCIYLLLVVLFCVQSLFAQGLKEFQENVEEEENSSAQNSKSNSKPSSAAGNEDANIATALFTAVAGVFAAIWYDINNAARYDEYPYASEGRTPIEFAPFADEEVLEAPYPVHNARSFMNFEVYYQIQEAATRAAGIDGRWRFTPVFGVLGHYRQFFEPGQEDLHDARLGLEMAFLQTTFMQSALQLNYTSFSGTLERTGLSSGLDFIFFPGRPLLLEIYLGSVTFSKISFFELRPKLGILIGRLEFFTAGYLLSSQNAELKGIEFGTRVWL
ncbi:MAG: hypothetical protein KDK41_14510 [Leptospiraceae bacterium]|nr:hypothetical protein [Leptospiraceae bacterium]